MIHSFRFVKKISLALIGMVLLGSGILSSGPVDASGLNYYAPTDVVIDENVLKLDSDLIDTTMLSVNLEVTPTNGVAYMSIPASILKKFEVKNPTFYFEIKTPYGSFQVPANLASLIPGLQELLGANQLTADDISFKINLIDKSGDKAVYAAFAASLPNGSVMGTIVDFNIDIINLKTGQKIGSADKFNKALTRVIPMPKDLTDMPEQWGAFRYNEETKKFDFIPAKKVQVDGIWYVMLRSYSNSVYVVAGNSVRFTDIQQHWGTSFIELSAAKGLVNGIGGGLYEPNKAVTRAEFAAMLVRVLGRDTLTDSSVPYDDVLADKWYYGDVATAKEFGLLDFVSGSSYKPEQPLTREEMASMLAAVIVLEKQSITAKEIFLDRYKDIESVNPAYLEEVRLMIKLKIMQGISADTFSPKGITTRAEAATVLLRMLQAIGMLD